jgi:hypothetical protein
VGSPARTDSAVVYRRSRLLCFSRGLCASGENLDTDESAGDKGNPKVRLVVGVLGLLHGCKELHCKGKQETNSAQANLPEILFGVKREAERASSPS